MARNRSKRMIGGALGKWGVFSTGEKKASEVYLYRDQLVLRIHFWPFAGAQVRNLFRESWKDDHVHASRVLAAFIEKRHAVRELQLIGSDRQMEFAFVRELDLIHGFGCPIARALERAFHSVPTEVRDVLERLQSNPWPGLVFASRSQRACELAHAHLPLFSLWSRRLEGQREGLAEIDRHLQLPRHQQLERLGCASGRRWVKILGKLCPHAIGDLDWAAFARWTWQPEDASLLKRLCHASRIPVALLNLLTDPHLRVHVPASVLEKCFNPEARSLLSATIALAKLHHRLPAAKQGLPIPLKSKALLRAGRRARAALKAIRSDPDTRLPELAPTPPDWVFLNCAEVIVEEGLLQENCLAEDVTSYLDSEFPLYRVEKPVRATLQLSQGENGFWEISEIYAKANRLVSCRHRNQLVHALRKAQMWSDIRRQAPVESACLDLF